MARRKAKAEAELFRTIDLTAKVMRPYGTPPYKATQAEMGEIFDVSERTLRTWHDIGLPRESDARGRVVYPFPDANIWCMCYRAKVDTSPYRKGPRHLTVEEAHAWHLAMQYQTRSAEFVLVPVDWDHPMREQMLVKAAAGQEPPPSEDDL